MGKKIAEADHAPTAACSDKIPIQRDGDDTPYHLLVEDLLAKAYPIGAVFLSVVSTDPALLLGFGTWSQIAQGRALFGQTDGDADFDTAEETGGAKTSAALLAHTHGVTDPGHTHELQLYAHGTGTSGNKPEGTNATTAQGSNGAATAAATTGITVDSAGSGDSFPILPPYLVVYIWKRVA